MNPKLKKALRVMGKVLWVVTKVTGQTILYFGTIMLWTFAFMITSLVGANYRC